MVGGISNSSTTSISQMWQNILNKLDSNGDGSIDKSEFAAGAPQKKGASFEDIFTKMDTDSDGLISKSEYESASAKFAEKMKASMQMDSQDMFAKIDQNGDGAIDKSEFAAAAPPQGGPGGGAPPPGGPGGGAPPTDAPGSDNIFTSMDTNGDGVISQSEFEAATAKFEEQMNASMQTDTTDVTDTTDTVNTSAASLLSGLLNTAQDSGTLFSSIDQNGDGVIDKSELVTARNKVEMSIADIFNKIGSNSNGLIGSDELNSILTSTQSNPSLSALGDTNTGQTRTNGIFDTILKAYTSTASTGPDGSSDQSSGSISLIA